MSFTESTPTEREAPQLSRAGVSRYADAVVNHVVAGTLAVFILYLSLLATSVPVSSGDRQTIERAIGVLADKGFDREVFLLRHVTTFRAGGNWINEASVQENAYAATNFPFEIITIYPDFYTKAADDTERAMILLHEAQHLQAAGEREAYTYVWQNRNRLGWTLLTHGTTPTFITIESQTRENAPDLFTCSANLWSDCTERLRAAR